MKVFEEMKAKQVMNRVKEPRMPFSWSINPYRGCAHGCSFCYARRTHSFLGMEADDSFQHHIFLKTNAAEALEEQLAGMARRCRGDLREVARKVGLVAIGTATDPYQPVEGKAELTRNCLKVLARYRIPTTITTRSPLILRDLDVLKQMRITSINISVNTLNVDLCRRLEPAAPHPARRLDTVRKLAENGLPTGIFLAPVLPYLTDSVEDLEALVQAAKEHRAQYVLPSVLRLMPEAKAWYLKTLRKEYPELVPAYLRLYRFGYPQAEYTRELQERVSFLLNKYGFLSNIPAARYEEESVPAETAEAGEAYSAGAGYEGEQLSFLF